MAFPDNVDNYPDFQQLIKPSLTLNSVDDPLLLSSACTSSTTTPQDDFWLLPENLLSYPLRKKRLETATANVQEKQPWYKRLPYFTLLVSIFQIFIHILFVIKYDDIYGVFVFDPGNNKQIWRYLTYMLLHSDLSHLIMNILMQFLVAAPLEWYQGSLSTAIIYFTGIIFGTLGTFIFQSGTKVIGASAGTYALLLAHCADCFMNKNRKYLWIQISAFVLIIIIDIFYTTLHIYNKGNTWPKVGWSAHYAGALNGFLLGFVFFKGTLKKDTTVIKSVRIVCGLLWLALLLAAILLNIIKINVIESNFGT